MKIDVHAYGVVRGRAYTAYIMKFVALTWRQPVPNQTKGTIRATWQQQQIKTSKVRYRSEPRSYFASNKKLPYKWVLSFVICHRLYVHLSIYFTFIFVMQFTLFSTTCMALNAIAVLFFLLWLNYDFCLLFLQVVTKFLQKHEFDLICRAHQVVEDGYEFFAKRQLVTLFSAPNYCGEFDNAGKCYFLLLTLICEFI